MRTHTLRRSTILAGIAAAGILPVVPRAARADDTLRIAFVPEVGATPQTIAEKKPVVDYLQDRLKKKIDLIIPQNYAATVTAIGNGSVDFAHFGGLTYVIARKHYGVIPVVQRAEDQQFHSLFIASAANPGLNSVAALKGKSFAFGDVASTSGHLIPAKDMYDAKVDPETDIKARFTGNHPATAIAVASGQVDAGALDESVYHKMVSEKSVDPTKARVFFTSEAFTDYVWAARKDLDQPTIAALRSAFVSCKEKAVLDVLRASKYVPANDQEYAAIRTTADRLKLLS